MAVFSFKFDVHNFENQRDPNAWTLSASGHGEESIDEAITRMQDFKAQYLKELEHMRRCHLRTDTHMEAMQLVNEFGVDKVREMIKDHRPRRSGGG